MTFNETIRDVSCLDKIDENSEAEFKSCVSEHKSERIGTQELLDQTLDSVQESVVSRSDSTILPKAFRKSMTLENDSTNDLIKTPSEISIKSNISSKLSSSPTPGNTIGGYDFWDHFLNLWGGAAVLPDKEKGQPELFKIHGNIDFDTKLCLVSHVKRFSARGNFSDSKIISEICSYASKSSDKEENFSISSIYSKFYSKEVNSSIDFYAKLLLFHHMYKNQKNVLQILDFYEKVEFGQIFERYRQIQFLKSYENKNQENNQTSFNLALIVLKVEDDDREEDIGLKLTLTDGIELCDNFYLGNLDILTIPEPGALLSFSIEDVEIENVGLMKNFYVKFYNLEFMSFFGYKAILSSVQRQLQENLVKKQILTPKIERAPLQEIKIHGSPRNSSVSPFHKKLALATKRLQSQYEILNTQIEAAEREMEMGLEEDFMVLEPKCQSPKPPSIKQIKMDPDFTENSLTLECR